tara:strand:+ start:5822 stop:6004 length:183 start_codon:yes stop_codon:yes gene_type:complete
MISKIYEIGAKYKLTQMGRRKGTKRPNKSQAYKEAIAMSSLSPSIKRVVSYRIKKKTNKQ